jgi:uncharacterized protein YegP (UPF0339 family)
VDAKEHRTAPASGQAYKTKAGCKKGIESVVKNASVATLLEE